MTPNQTAGLIASASGSNPGGGGPAVSGSENESLISRWTSTVTSAVSSLAKKTVTALSPANVLVPGGSEAAQAAAKAAQSAGSVAESAGEGIKAGFSKATFIIVIVAAFFLWRTFK